MRKHSPWQVVVLSAALVLLVGAVYGRVAGNAFIDYDDLAYITNNAHVRSGLNADTVAWAFTTGYHSNWHPLTWLSHALDFELFGIDPAGHHIVSVALHAANAVLLFVALFVMTGALWRSAVVAALFALHPLHVESVAWAAERKDVLSTLFWMLVLLVYARHAAGPTTATRWLLPLLLGLGLMAKPMLVTLPFVLLLIDFWPLGRWDVQSPKALRPLIPPFSLVREKLPMFALVAVSSVVTWIAQQRGGAVAALDALPLSSRLANSAIAYVTYLAKAFWPVGLGVLYPFPASLPAWKVVGALAILAVVTFGALRLARRAPYLATGWLWYLGTLVPVIGLVQVGVQSYADRYTYIPLIGVFIMLAWGLPDLVGAWRFRSPVLGVAAVLALACCSALTWRQVGYWKDSETLFERTLAVTSGNYVVHSNLGGTLLRENRLDEAIRHLEEARRIRPDHVAALSNLGVAVQGKGRVGEAIELYREALRLRPSHVEAWLNLGNALEKTGDLDGALAAFREAKRQMPDEPSIGTRIQAILARQQRPDARASYDRGNRLRDGGRLEDAATAYREAIGIDPSFADAHNNLGSVLGRQGRTEEAIAEFEKALEIAPNLSAAHNNLAIALAIRGDTAQAATHLAEVLRLDPRDAVAHYNLGLLLAKQGKTADAIAHYEEALRIQPGYESAARAIEQARRR